MISVRATLKILIWLGFFLASELREAAAPGEYPITTHSYHRTAPDEPSVIFIIKTNGRPQFAAVYRLLKRIAVSRVFSCTPMDTST